MAAPSRVTRMTRLTPGESYRRHIQRKKVVALIAGLLLLPVSVVTILSFDRGPMGQAFAEMLGLAIGPGPVAQIIPDAVTEQSPSSGGTEQSPSSGGTATPGFGALDATPTVQMATPTPTPVQPPKPTLRPTSTRQAPLPTAASGSFQSPLPSPLPTATAAPATPSAMSVSAPTQSSSAPTPTGPPPDMLPVTGLRAAPFTGQVIGFVLLAISVMLIAAGLWPQNEGDRR